MLRDYGLVEDYPRRFALSPRLMQGNHATNEDPLMKVMLERGMKIPDSRANMPYKRLQFDLIEKEGPLAEGELPLFV